jgi:nitrogen fixation NifU-like protein
MSFDLNDLYQELILDHNRSPRNYGPLEHPAGKAEGFNPLCGDRVTVYVKIEDDVVVGASFEGSGCAISTASASLMTEAVKGKTTSQVRALFDQVHRLMTGECPVGETSDRDLGKLEVFAGVGRYPARVKCATLAWHTVKAAIDNTGETVSTE